MENKFALKFVLYFWIGLIGFKFAYVLIHQFFGVQGIRMAIIASFLTVVAYLSGRLIFIWKEISKEDV